MGLVLKMNWTDWLSRVVQSTKMAFPPCVLCGSVALLWRDSQYLSLLRGCSNWYRNVSVRANDLWIRSSHLGWNFSSPSFRINISLFGFCISHEQGLFFSRRLGNCAIGLQVAGVWLEECHGEHILAFFLLPRTVQKYVSNEFLSCCGLSRSSRIEVVPGQRAWQRLDVQNEVKLLVPFFFPCSFCRKEVFKCCEKENCFGANYVVPFEVYIFLSLFLSYHFSSCFARLCNRPFFLRKRTCFIHIIPLQLILEHAFWWPFRCIYYSSYS